MSPCSAQLGQRRDKRADREFASDALARVAVTYLRLVRLPILFRRVSERRQFSLLLGEKLGNPLPLRLVQLGEQQFSVVLDVKSRNENTLVHDALHRSRRRCRCQILPLGPLKIKGPIWEGKITVLRLQSLAEEGALVEFAEAPRPAVSRRAVGGLAQDQEPGCACRAAGRGRTVVAREQKIIRCVRHQMPEAASAMSQKAAAMRTGG